MFRFSKFVGSVRIQLLLWKTESGRHGCKIIFKWVDSAVITVFNFFFLNNVGEGAVNSALCLLHSESMCMNCAVTIHLRWKKKKKEKEKEMRNQKRRCAISQTQLLQSESLGMSSAVTIHMRWKKEKKETWN